MTQPNPLTLSVVVPTRNRRDHALACARTLLAADGFIELIVIDQSDGTGTRDALTALADSRLRYVPSDMRGVTRGRNLGIELSSGAIVAFTDDDCRVKPDWAFRLMAIFASQPDVAVVCGRVGVPAELRHLGFAETFQPREREWQTRYPPMGQWGITANFAIRRSVLAQVGRFDPMLGAGAPLQSGGEPDLLFRVLRSGLKVVNADEVVVDHLGIRKHGLESQKLLKGYGAGTAAAFLKHVRLKDPAAAGIYLGFLVTTVRQVAGKMLRGRRPSGAGYLLAFLSGSLRSCRFPVDRARREYQDRRSAASIGRRS